MKKTPLEELAVRELARRSLVKFGSYMMEDFNIYRHTHFIGNELERVFAYISSRGMEGTGKLMVLTPPQHGKSLLAAILFTSWCLGKLPNLNTILVSYNAKRAEKNSRDIRDLIRSSNYKNVFGELSNREEPVSIANDNRGISSWGLAAPNKGGLVSAGVGGSITGYRANLIIIDDPFAGRIEAESALEREKVIDWYESQIYTRQQTGTAIILFHTRWHPEDLAGTIIKRMAKNKNADQWNIINLPAVAYEKHEYPVTKEDQESEMLNGIYIPFNDPLNREAGEVLCPQMVSEKLIGLIKENTSSYNFESLYQQKPFLKTGGFFKKEMFTSIFEKLPEDVVLKKAVWYWDKAATVNEDSDFSSGALLAIDNHEDVWVLEVIRGQWETYERNRNMKDGYERSVRKYKFSEPPQIWHPQDPGSAGIDSALATSKALRPYPSHFEVVSGSKVVRAEPWQSALECKSVRFIDGNWMMGLILEHLQFPKGKHDDQIDAISSAYSKLMSLEGKKSLLPMYVESTPFPAFPQIQERDLTPFPAFPQIQERDLEEGARHEAGGGRLICG